MSELSHQARAARRRHARERIDRARDAAMRAGRLIDDGPDEEAFAAITDVVERTNEACDALEEATSIEETAPS